MLQRKRYTLRSTAHQEDRKCESESFQTCQDSPRERSQHFKGRPCKQKSQLCKKFMENGRCPYDKRCKFAHGLHQLKNYQQYNHKYKTKECESFREGCCMYGNRCNYIHHSHKRTLQDKLATLNAQLWSIRGQGKKQSRLMRMLSIIQ